MVLAENINRREVYRCDACGLRYREREWAEKCEAWCTEHNSCNIEITAHAVESESSASDTADNRE